MKKAILMIVFLVFITGCGQNSLDEGISIDLEFIKHNALYLMSSNDDTQNILYLKGDLNNREDISSLKQYLNYETQIYLVNDESKTEAGKFYWTIFEGNEGKTFDLLIYLENIMDEPFEYNKIMIETDSTIKEYDLGRLVIYTSDTADTDVIMTTSSPYALEIPPKVGQTFRVDYDIRLNPIDNIDEEIFDIYVSIPESYKDLSVEYTEMRFCEEKTREYIDSRTQKDDYINLKIYEFSIVYKRLGTENIHIQPLLIAETGNERFYFKPFTPFFIYN